MSDTAGLPSAIGIEAVEWITDDPSGLTVRITGRWRRRRPEWRGPAMLVVEAEGRRHRIPAMPEPPFLIGLLPGMWRMSFSIPAELADGLEGGTWLALGAVLVPITLAPPGRPAPPDVPPVSEPELPAPARPPVDRELLAARELRSLEAAAQSAWRRAEAADELAARLRGEIAALQDELTHAREEPARLRSVIEARERDLRKARQEIHAEVSRRAEREEELAEQERVLARLRERARAMTQREYELERDLRRMHRAVDEAHRAAAIAREAAAHAAPEPRPAPGPAPAQTVIPATGLAAEFALAATAPRSRSRPGRLPTLPHSELELERTLVANRPALHERPDTSALEREHATLQLEYDAIAAVLTREREARAAAERRVAALEQDLERQRERSRRALAAIEAFRRELHAMRTAPPAAPAPEERPAIARPEVMPVVPTPPRPEPVDTAFEADRLSAALARLRETRPAEPEPPAAPAAEAPGPPEPAEAPIAPDTRAVPTATTDALPRLFRALVREDPPAAGRLVLALLSAQRRVHPRPVAYDLVLGPTACVQVTVGSGAPVIAFTTAARTAEEVQVRIDGDPAGLARLLAAGRLRARLGRGMPRVTGDRAAIAALRALVSTPLSLDDLIDAGVSLDPGLALRLVAEQVGPGLPEAFSVAHRPSAEAPPDAVLQAAPGQAPSVIETPLELPATTTIICPPAALVRVLAGREAPRASIRGEARPLALLRRALQRA